MRNELDELLCVNFPKIFENRNGDMTQTAMCWGFEHGDGWYDILFALCARIQHHIDWTQKQRSEALKYNSAVKLAKNGDTTALTEYFSNGSKKNGDWAKQMVERSLESGEREVPDECPQVIAVQVKEKFGTLRFYYDGGDNYVRGLVSMAEWASAHTCETCGERGKIRGTGWVYVSCNEHAKEEDKDNAQ
jgi:hypothetical protein